MHYFSKPWLKLHTCTPTESVVQARHEAILLHCPPPAPQGVPSGGAAPSGGQLPALAPVGHALPSPQLCHTCMMQPAPALSIVPLCLGHLKDQHGTVINPSC